MDQSAIFSESRWARQAERLVKGAERANNAGDVVAFVALLSAAAECLQIARSLGEDLPEAADG